MKAITLFFACLFFSLSSYGQNIINADFENWVAVPNSFGAMDPQGWLSTNAATSGGNIKGINMSTDKYSGTYALALSPLAAWSATDTLTSAIVVGQAPVSFSNYKLDYAKGGQTFTTMATSVNGYYKFTKGTTSYDSAYAIVLLKDASGPGYKGIGKLTFTTSATYIPFQINIIHQGAPGGQVDSLVIAFFYTSNNQSPMPAGKLLIDSLYYKQQLLTTGIKKEQDALFNLFPNPFNETITVQFKTPGNYKLELFSANGQLCQEYKVEEAGHYLLRLPGLEKGIYFIRGANLENGDLFRRVVCKE